MKLNFTVLTIIVALSCQVAYAAKTQTKRYDHYEHQRIQYVRAEEAEQPEFDNEPKGYSIGSGLRSIAQGSADQATSAVASQHAAATQAAYVAKSTLAQSAIQAASTALAALAGKEVLLHSLEHQRDEAAKNLEGELHFLQLSKRTIVAAKQTFQNAQNQAATIAAVLNNAQALIEFADNTVQESAAQLAKQTEMVGKSKARLETIEHKLKSVKIDFEATKEAAEKAAQSASEAQNNANAAAQHATDGLHNAAQAYQTSAGFVVKHEGYSVGDAYGEHGESGK